MPDCDDLCLKSDSYFACEQMLMSITLPQKHQLTDVAPNYLLFVLSLVTMGL